MQQIYLKKHVSPPHLNHFICKGLINNISLHKNKIYNYDSDQNSKDLHHLHI